MGPSAVYLRFGHSTSPEWLQAGMSKANLQWLAQRPVGMPNVTRTACLSTAALSSFSVVVSGGFAFITTPPPHPTTLSCELVIIARVTTDDILQNSRRLIVHSYRLQTTGRIVCICILHPSCSRTIQYSWGFCERS